MNEKLSPTYVPSVEVQERREERYSDLQEMIELKTETKPHFSMSDAGEMSFLQYIDYSERILNGYTPSRDMQGKEDWQSNIVDNITRAKLRALAAGVGLKVPEMKYVATNKNGLRSNARAEIIKETVRHTFLDGNPTMQAFLEVWGMLAQGVLIEYDGYLSGGAKRKVVESFNSETGEITVKEEYVKVDGKPISIIISPNDFYWWDWYKRDIQDQPELAWLQRYTKREIETEFSKYKNFKFIRTKSELSSLSMQQETMHYKAWSSRVGDDDYEVFRFYSKEDDAYEIWVNGVEILSAPLLWGEKEKRYPFAKTISEPFADTNFFVGMSFPHLLEAYQVTKTTILNTVVDKLYRSLVPPMLIGLANKDLLDAESELVNQDNRWYVPDVNQVKPWPYKGVDQGDLAMLEVMNQAIDHLSVDVNQQGQQGKGVTAREVVIADERARQLKGILFMFLEDLWLQKNRLRVQTILTQYMKDKAKRIRLKDKIITVPDVVFSDGARGVLDIHVANTKSQLMPVVEIEAREEAMARQGLVYKIISITKDYLDDWEYDFEVIPESLYNQDRLRKETDITEKHQRIAAFFPEHFVANKDKFFAETVELYGDSPDDYEPPAPPAPTPLEPGAEAEGAPTPLETGQQMLKPQG